MLRVWKSTIPLKIKHFIYHAGRNWIPYAFQFDKKKWKGGGGTNACKMCGGVETVSYVLFT